MKGLGSSGGSVHDNDRLLNLGDFALGLGPALVFPGRALGSLIKANADIEIRLIMIYVILMSGYPAGFCESKNEIDQRTGRR